MTLRRTKAAGRTVRLVLPLLALSYSSAASAQTPALHESGLSNLEIISAGFDRVLSYPSVRSVELRVYRSGKLRAFRGFDLAYRRFEERGHTLLRFTEPEYLRGHTLLIVEKPYGSNDAWLFNPEVGRIRRVSMHQRADSFFGSDLTYEDLEHQVWDRYTLTRLADESREGKGYYAIEAIPPGDSQYSKINVLVERRRLALFEVEFFTGSPPRLQKTLNIELDGAVTPSGHIKATSMLMVRSDGNAKTEVQFSRIEVGSNIVKRIFSTNNLERGGGDLFDLVERMAE